MRAARDDSLHVRGPIRARSAQVPAHRTPTRAHVSTATGRASPQYEFPTFSEHSFSPWGSPISRSVEGRALTREACVGVMESEVIRLRVSWRRDASSDEALQAVVKAVHTGFGTSLATDGEAATQMALRYEDDDGEMCRLTALTLEDCLDTSSNMVKLFAERVPLEARADRSVSLGVQDSAEVQADETSLSAVMSVDSGHRAITVEAAADVCKGPLCCGGGREAHLQSVLQSISVRRWLDDSIEEGC